jgi:hypothetical protein
MPITRKQIIIGIVVVVIVAAFLYKKYVNRSKYAIPPTTTSDTNTTRQTTYSSNLVACETQYINDMNAADPNANTKVNNCISSNVVAYYNARCPFLPQGTGTTGALTGAGNILNGTSNVAYMAYKTDIDAINAVYTPLIAAAGQTASTLVIQAARKADFTGATRKYFATLCPDLYSNTMGNTLQTTYTGWTRSSTAAYGWDSSLVTTARIWEWAKYAGQPPTTGTDGSYTAPTKPLLGPPTLNITDAAACSSLFTANWQLAADNGPGTRNTADTLPWNTAVPATCPPSATFITGATASNPLP